MTEQNFAMAEANQSQPANSPASPRFLPWLLLLFVGSGAAALIYEIVWFQLLQLVIGSSAVSLGVLLGTFMGGMCLGSVALPRLISASRHPLRVYALLEVGIGLIGIAVLFGVPQVARVYMANVGHGLPGILLRGVVCTVCLLPPTLLMGATLPAIARWVETTPRGVSWLGFFYGGNIVGAVFGCLLAGFYLLRVHDMMTATYVAAAINGAVALMGLGLAALAPHESLQSPSHAGSPPDESLLSKSQIANRKSQIHPSASVNWPVYLTIALSGLCALGAEVIWTRLLSLLLGATVYTFSIILAVFLIGLGLGSSVGSFLARGMARPRLALGCCQMLLAAAIAWTAVMLANSLPYWPINPSLSRSAWFTFQIDLVRCLWAILPAACLWGASFPLALAAVASRGQDPGRLVGGVYAANTVGAIVGALGFSMLMIEWVGTQQAQRVLIGLSAASAFLMLVPLLWPLRAGAAESDNRPSENASSPPSEIVIPKSQMPPESVASSGPGFMGPVTLMLLVAMAAWLAASVSKVPWGLVAYGRSLANRDNIGNLLYMGEGMNASVAVTELFDGVRNFHVSGKVEASSEPQDMRLQRMLGHIPALVHPKPRSVLIVGCGAGVTSGSFVLHPSIERIVICEIEPLIPRVVAQFFDVENYNVLKDPRVEVVYDDARHYVLTTQEKFDIITSDPIHPWVKGAATLYTKEYFELVKRHLNPGGVVTQWVPLYESNLNVVKSEVATFFDVFPNGTIWSNDEGGKGYDTVLLGQADATRINVDELQERLARGDHSRVLASLQEVGFKSAVDVLATYAGQGRDMGPWLKGAEINRDRNLRLQYLAGMGLNLYQEAAIYSDMLVHRKFPEDLFVAAEESRQALRKALEPGNSVQ
jgi:spermidine synthase